MRKYKVELTEEELKDIIYAIEVTNWECASSNEDMNKWENLSKKLEEIRNK